MKPICLIAAICLMAVTGCDNRGIYVAHETVVGLNAQIKSDSSQGKIMLGYDRDFVALVPTLPHDSQGQSGGRNAMSHANCTTLTVTGIFVTEYRDVSASGAAAAHLFDKDNGINMHTCKEISGGEG
ncbi:hypothetical protein [Sulfitobacter sp. AS59]|jgi:hypothetical protein|uniref:hypothetical protein n=1 Tax=Sulfitobacter sp. AS59 TaxID=3135784 RepID=UPI0031736F8E